ncbi:MAG: hypothetical protein JXB35_02860 [Anaerolineae bacterium]|nr:hypothetical protein [Anaerolineae bacterium]
MTLFLWLVAGAVAGGLSFSTCVWTAARLRPERRGGVALIVASAYGRWGLAAALILWALRDSALAAVVSAATFTALQWALAFALHRGWIFQRGMETLEVGFGH